MTRARKSIKPGDKLSQRETEALGQLCRGATIPEAAQAMGVSISTVRTHQTNMFVKLMATNMVEAAYRAGFERLV